MKKVIAACIDQVLQFDSEQEVVRFLEHLRSRKQNFRLIWKEDLGGVIQVRIKRQYNNHFMEEGDERMNKNKLVGVMKEHGDRQEDLARYIGISLQRFNAKINETDGAEFTQGEMKRIKEKYNLTSEQVDEIFFKDGVALQAT